MICMMKNPLHLAPEINWDVDGIQVLLNFPPNTKTAFRIHHPSHITRSLPFIGFVAPLVPDQTPQSKTRCQARTKEVSSTSWTSSAGKASGVLLNLLLSGSIVRHCSDLFNGRMNMSTPLFACSAAALTSTITADVPAFSCPVGAISKMYDSWGRAFTICKKKDDYGGYDRRLDPTVVRLLVESSICTWMTAAL